MRLINIAALAKNAKESFSSISEWNEVKISESLKRGIKSIPSLTKLSSFTGTITTGTENIIIFPYQYFLFCVLIKPLASVIKDYKLLLDQLIEECRNQNIELAKVIMKKSSGEFDPDVSRFIKLIALPILLIQM
ncbi:MAG: hypothetical protein U0073_03720 [Bacteroidia bacterium]